MSTHSRSLSPDSSSVESSIAARVKNIQIGATRASYGNRRAPNLQIRSSSQGSSFGSFESQSNPYGGTGGLRLDKIVSICSTISDDFTPRQKKGGGQKLTEPYCPLLIHHFNHLTNKVMLCQKLLSVLII